MKHPFEAIASKFVPALTVQFIHTVLGFSWIFNDFRVKLED